MSFEEFGEHFSSSFNESGHMPLPRYIPPPPAHHPPPLPARQPQAQPAHHHPPPPPAHQPPQLHGKGCHNVSRTPFRQLQPHTTSVQRKSIGGSIPSSVINKSKLVEPEQVLKSHPKLMCVSKLPTLAVKLAKESFFGAEVMSKCTVAGNRDLPGLPTKELDSLKHTLFTLFPQYWQSPQEFEPLWKSCTEAVGQACKRLR